MPVSWKKNPNSQETLGLTGDVFCKYASFQEDDTTKFSGSSSYKSHLQQLISVYVENINVFIARAENIEKAESMLELERRELILPFTCEFIKEAYKIQKEQSSSPCFANKNKLNINSFSTALTFSDALLLAGIWEYQEKLESKITKPPKRNVKEAEPQKLREQIRAKEVKEFLLEDSWWSDDEERESFIPSSTRISKQQRDNRLEERSSFQRREFPFVKQSNGRPKTTHGKETFLTSISLEENPLGEVDEDEEEVIFDKNNINEFIVVTKDVQMIVLDKDKQGNQTPAIRLRVFDASANVIQGNKTVMNGQFIFDVGCHNSSIFKWEPIIEKFGIKFDLTLQETPKIGLKLSNLDGFATLNANISDHMAPVLSSLMKNYPQKGQNTQVTDPNIQSSGKQNSPYPCVILNRTGYPIEIQIFDTKSHKASMDEVFNANEQVYSVENNATIEHLFSSILEQYFAEDSDYFTSAMPRIEATILHPTENLFFLSPIDIHKQQTLCYDVKNKKNTKSFKVYCNVKFESNKMLITLSSGLVLYNSLPLAYDLNVSNSSGDSIPFSLEPEKFLPVPIDYTSDFVLMIKEQRPYSQEPKLVSRKEILPFPTERSKTTEIAFDSSLFLVECQKPFSNLDFYQVSFTPAMTFRNYCVLPIYFEVSTYKEETHKKTVHCLQPTEEKPETDLYFASTSSSGKTSVCVKFENCKWSARHLISSEKKNEATKKIVRKFSVEDSQGKALSVHMVISEENGVRKIMFYTTQCIVNESPYDLVFYNCSKEKAWEMLPHQPSSQPIVLSHGTKALGIKTFGGQECVGQLSIEKVGNQWVNLKSKDGQHGDLDVGVHISRMVIDRPNHIVTKVVTISPHYVIVNKTKNDIEVKAHDPENATEGIIRLGKGVRSPLHHVKWSPQAADGERNICVRFVEGYSATSRSIWGWSKYFSIIKLGVSHFVVQKEVLSNEFQYIKATVSSHKATLFITIEEVEPSEVPFRIENACEDVEISAYQSYSKPTKGINLKPGQNSPWSWRHPSKKQEVTVEFTTKGLGNYHFAQSKFCFNKFNQPQVVEILAGNKGKIKVLGEIKIEGDTKVLRFTEPQGTSSVLQTLPRKGDEATPSAIKYDIGVYLPKIGLSIITNGHNTTRKEAAYICIDGFKLKLVETNEKRFHYLALRNLVLNNNLNYNAIFPVVLAPSNSNIPASSERKFLDLTVVQRHQSKMLVFETIQASIQETNLYLEGEFIKNIMSISQQMKKAAMNNLAEDVPQSLTKLLLRNPGKIKELRMSENLAKLFEWNIIQVPDLPQDVFIKDLLIQSLALNVSLKVNKEDLAEDDTSLAKNVLYSVIADFARLNKVPIKLENTHLINFFGTMEGLIYVLANRYLNDAFRSLLRWLASLQIVRSPLGIYQIMFPGIVGRFLNPFGELFRGVSEDADSMMRRAAIEMLSSVYKVNNTIASGLSKLTLDDEYEEERKVNNTHPPENVGEALYQGMVLFGKGVVDGLIGPVVKPVQGVVRSGVKGLLLGMYQGVTGVWIKPIIGTIDAASLVAGGIKNTVVKFEAQSKEYRVRLPRAFYGPEKYYQDYEQIDADTFVILYEADPKGYRDFGFIEAFHVTPEDQDVNSNSILVLTNDVMLAWDIKKEETIWNLNIKEIRIVEILKYRLQIGLYDATKQFEDKYLEISNIDSVQNEIIGNKLREIQVAKQSK